MDTLSSEGRSSVGGDASERSQRSRVSGPIGMLAVATVALSCFVFLVSGITAINESPSAGFEDTGPYLQGALIIKENGGLFGFIRQCVEGTFKVAEQQPAYLIVLSTFASRDIDFIRQAQIATLLIGLLVVVVVFLSARDLFGDLTAASSSLLLALNGAFLVRSSHVAVETLLILFVVLSWWFTIKGCKDGRYWAAAGLAAGCAYMTKATALVIVPAFAAFAILLLGRAALRRRSFWLFFVMFLVLCVPWMIRNVIVYDAPIYGGVADHAPWLDRWSQLSDPRYGQILDWKHLTYTWNGLPTMSSYLADHSIAEIARRTVTGVIGEARLVVGALTLTIYPFSSSMFGLVFLLAAVSAVLLDIRSARGQLTCILGLAFALPFAWYYQVVPENRFVMPLIPLAVTYASHAVCGAIGRLHATRTQAARLDPRLLAAGALVICGFFACGAVLMRSGGIPALAPAALDRDQEELFAYLRDNARDEDGLLLAPTRRYFGYLWYANYRGKEVTAAGNSPLMVSSSLTDFTGFLKSRGVTIVVVHSENLSSPPALRDYFDYDQERGLSQTQDIDGWNLVHRDSGRRFLIFRLNASEGPTAKVG
jgi:hypothetical protein